MPDTRNEIMTGEHRKKRNNIKAGCCSTLVLEATKRQPCLHSRLAVEFIHRHRPFGIRYRFL